MNDRTIILKALAGADEKDEPGDVLGYVLERAEAEARFLTECFDQTLPATEWLLAISHLERLEALRRFIDEHMDVTYREPSSFVAENKPNAPTVMAGAEHVNGSAES